MLSDLALADFRTFARLSPPLRAEADRDDHREDGGFTQGQRMTVTELYELRAELPPEDQRVLACTREVMGRRELTPEAHEMLIGHPRVFNGARGVQPVEVVRGSCRIETVEEPGHIRIVVEPEGATLGVNVVLLAVCVYCAVRVGRARAGPWAGTLLGASFVIATVVPVFVVWLTSELFNFTTVLVAYYLWTYKKVAPASARAGGAWADMAAALLLGVATYSKLTNALLVIPRSRCQDVRLIVDELKRQGQDDKL